MQQANRNVQQANNMMQTAEGGLNQIHGILARMRELAVQSASDGVNGDDRASIDLEFQQLKAEITRIGDGTEYNNMKLIDGSRAKGVDLTGSTLDATSASAEITSFSISSNVETGTQFNFAEITSSAGEYTSFTLRDATNDTTQKLEMHDSGGFVKGDVLNFDELGVSIELGDSFGTIATSTNSGTLSSGDFLTVDNSNFTTVQVGSNNDADQAASVASVGANATENRITFNIADATSEGLGISTTDLDSLGDAQSAINYLDAAIEKINDERGNIGSLQNRFEFASSNLMNSIQNNSASMSTIRDADFAVEAADLARNQILTQSGTAMLAQANSLSQNVLSLIR
ncbi:MAG: flagellin, partial [Gammaproteobacteria bacterium]|nr:flagellin [Gammaproteobacteria bacterium]